MCAKAAPHASPFWMKQLLTRPLTQKISCRNPPAVQLRRLMLRGGCLAASKVLAAVQPCVCCCVWVPPNGCTMTVKALPQGGWHHGCCHCSLPGYAKSGSPLLAARVARPC